MPAKESKTFVKCWVDSSEKDSVGTMGSKGTCEIVHITRGKDGQPKFDRQEIKIDQVYIIPKKNLAKEFGARII